MIIYIHTEMLAVALPVQLLRSTRLSLALMKLNFLSALCLQLPGMRVTHCVTISHVMIILAFSLRAEFSFTSGSLDGHWYDMGVQI
jgi:hypothetical protein